MLVYLHHINSKLFFHPAKFDNFKDEKISDYKTCLSSTKQKLAGLKTAKPNQLWVTFWGKKNYKKNFAPKNIKKKLPSKVVHNWESFIVWNFLIFEAVKLCRMKKYPPDSTYKRDALINSTSLSTFSPRTPCPLCYDGPA